jgi:midasin
MTGKDTLQSIGACWIALSKLILSLVIPDAPVDPAVVKACSFDRIRYHENSLGIQISLHRKLEKLLTGNADNELTRFLKPQLQNVNEQLEKVPNLPKRNDVSRLHLFWSEVSQFQKNIILSKKVEGLFDALLNGNEDAIFRERVTQESLTGFYQRLDSVYPEFADISILLKLAVLYMQIGLRLAVQSAILSSSPNSLSATLVSSLLAFPSVASCTRISKDFKSIKSSDITAINQILLTLAAVSLERSLGTDSEHHLNMVDEAYDQATRLWLIDRAKETEELEASNMLYRHSNLHHEAVTDAEIEEAEFLELFPTYQDALESDSMHISNGKPHTTRLVQGMDMVLLVDIHHDLISQRSSRSSAVQSRFDALRSRIIQLLLTCSPESLPQTLDQTSVHFQITILHTSLSQLDNVQSSTKSPYNFYRDQNVVQLRCAADVLSALKQRLRVISDEWPDQMVLKHLLERCDAILMLRSNTPVAKVLSAIEQLLVHTEDWEMYANKENTIKIHRDALIRLIVEWRRMELSCWQTLLDSQATLFAEEISEWWFRLYDALIRGSLSAAEQERSGGRQSLDHYIETLIPLLDSFFTSSPLGQFAARIELLGSFEKYIATIGTEKAPSHRSTMERVRRVLHSTHRYYDSFSDRLEKRLIDQKAELEKEVSKFVKLASWKDINVQALKESAQRTHHQLYKIIKKWRSFLRQPVAGHIQPWTSGASENQPLPMDILSKSHISVSLSRDTLATEDQSSVTIPSYLLHLERTLQRCHILIEQQLRPCLGSHSAQIVDDIAVEIITTSNELASISIPPKPGALREKQRKGLLVRKRKAWVDMLKELKRMGLASNVKPEILRQNMDQRWIREQPIMPIIPQSEFILRNGEIYFVKVSGCLPDLRASLSNHHSDLSTRELHRGRMFLESGFSMAVDLRSR